MKRLTSLVILAASLVLAAGTATATGATLGPAAEQVNGAER